MKLMQHATRPEAMNRAWRFYRNDPAHWLPGVSRRQIDPDAVYHLMKLAEELQGQSYQPARMRRFSLRRADGKTRQLAALSLRDKVAQRVIMMALLPQAEAEFHSDSFGYRPGRSVDMAICRARTHIADGYVWLVRTDIAHFFDEIPLGKLNRFLQQTVQSGPVLRLLAQWLDRYATRPSGWFRRGKGVPQGGVLSPLLANWYVSEVDQRLQRKGIRFVRYADDILLCCRTRKQAHRALRVLQKALKKRGLALSPDKTRICHASEKVRFLGQRLPRPPQW